MTDDDWWSWGQPQPQPPQQQQHHPQRKMFDCCSKDLKQLKMVLSFLVSNSRPSTPPLPPDTTYPQPPRDDKDKYTQKDKYKAKDARNSSVLMYIGCNTLWLIPFVHQYKDKDKDKYNKHCQRHNGPRNWLHNLATIWRHLHILQIWPPDGATCITCKYGQQMAPFTLVANLASRWRHLHKLQIWPPDGATCISCKYGHQMAPLAWVANLATRWRH